MPELLQPEYRFRPTGRQLLLLSDGQVVLLSIFAHDLPLLAITVPIIVFAFALLSILRSDRLTGAGKVIWIVVCFPLVGPIVWFIAGKSCDADISVCFRREPPRDDETPPQRRGFHLRARRDSNPQPSDP